MQELIGVQEKIGVGGHMQVEEMQGQIVVGECRVQGWGRDQLALQSAG